MSQPSKSTTESMQAPACFGAPSCYVGNSKICKICVAYSECGSAVTETLARIRNVINVDDLLHQHTQALDKARLQRRDGKENLITHEEKLEKPLRPMPKAVERKSKVEKITYEIDEKTNTLIGTLPVKAQPFAIQLCKSGMIDRIKKDVKDGLNPLEKTGPKFLFLALKLLMSGGFTKAELRMHYVEECLWGDNTAASHVSLAVRLFVMFEIAIENTGKFTISPTLLD